LDANTGKLLWKVDSIRDPVRRLGDNANGRPLWGPSGASVWNAPTVDPKRRRIYVGTGNSYGPVAADTSDSILALDMMDGHIVWSHQEFKGDSFMVGCGPKNPPGGNCPETLGPDWDFGGASIMLQTLPNGRDVLVAAGKGGVAIALDPDANGSVLWRTVLYEGQPPSALGLVLFGGTADGTRAYFPLQQPGGGLTAVQLDTGAIEWKARLDADRRGQGGAASSIPGAVFTGGWDGILRAVDGSGKVIWSVDTNGEFKTINGVPARGVYAWDRTIYATTPEHAAGTVEVAVTSRNPYTNEEVPYGTAQFTFSGWFGPRAERRPGPWHSRHFAGSIASR